ncbi:hypothetical protein HMP06_0451 [Sphingomonas sp. HMP6]|nr:hypothetical protein HMP06_0451 [Sphingomonas sp. HMP6]
MDLPRVLALNEHWKTNPPLSLTAQLIAEAVGVEFNARPLPATTDSLLAELIASIPKGPNA